MLIFISEYSINTIKISSYPQTADSDIRDTSLTGMYDVRTGTTETNKMKREREHTQNTRYTIYIIDIKSKLISKEAHSRINFTALT